jgi:hypothetical protein
VILKLGNVGNRFAFLVGQRSTKPFGIHITGSALELDVEVVR